MGNFRYGFIGFDLKNTGATYQRAMVAIFHGMLHDCLDDYVDDFIVKLKEVCTHVNDLRRVFVRCR